MDKHIIPTVLDELLDEPGKALVGKQEFELKSLDKTQNTPGPKLIIKKMNDGKTPLNDWSLENAVNDGYKVNPWVYSAITMNMNSLSSVPWIAQVKDKDGQWVNLDSDNEIYTLLSQPNPYTSWNDIIKMMSAHCDLCGNFYMYKNRAMKNKVKYLWILRPDYVLPIRDVKEYLTTYEVTINNKKEKYPAEDILHHMYINPADTFLGIGPLQAGKDTVNSDVAASEWQANSFNNRGMPDGALVYNHPMSMDQYKENETIVNRAFNTRNARHPLVLGADVKWQQFSMTPAEMDFIESRKVNLDQISAMFGVPRPLLSQDKLILANYETARLSYWADFLIPKLESFKSTLNSQLIQPDFGEEYRITYDDSKIEALMPMFVRKIETAKALFGSGIPWSIINKRLDLNIDTDEISNSDVGYLPMNLVPTTSVVDSTSEAGKATVPFSGKLIKY